MECFSCAYTMYGSMVTISNCTKCGESIVSGQYPSKVLCKKCSWDEKKCEQCGKDIIFGVDGVRE